MDWSALSNERVIFRDRAAVINCDRADFANRSEEWQLKELCYAGRPIFQR